MIAAIWRGEVLVALPGLDSCESLIRFAAMRTDGSVAEKPRPALRSKTFKVGDRASLKGSVLRVLSAGERKTLLILVEASGVKLTISPDVIKGGSKLKGGDAVVLSGTVTRVGASLVEELIPVSLAVDGYRAMRVTLAAKSLKKA